jgi:hypothetical protein
MVFYFQRSAPFTFFKKSCRNRIKSCIYPLMQEGVNVGSYLKILKGGIFWPSGLTDRPASFYCDRKSQSDGVRSTFAPTYWALSQPG